MTGLDHSIQRTLNQLDFLRFYSRVFPIVEIDSTFYSSPSTFMVELWKKKTPPDFLFTAKMPQKITHEKKLREVTEDIDKFHRAISLLVSNLSAF